MKKILFCVFCIMLFPAVSYSADTGKYYTRCNIWYEDPARIYSTNYHVGTIIPAGTAVDVVGVSERGGIMFNDDNGIQYTMTQVSKHSRIPFSRFFDRYFSESYPVELKKLSRAEEDAVKGGYIETGMSKDAVIASYGWPPTHETPGPEADIWKYWYNRFVTKLIYFGKDDKVVRIQE